MKLHEPESWSAPVYFGLGAVVGLLVGLGAAGILEARLGLGIAVSVGAALVGGMVGLGLRQHLLEILIRWF